ncbi:oxidoreductase 2-nitropropane dioxygenase family [Eremomyces bilateralis CBS 781.70]|uniref:Oxidoreductase 2-nitropropane dioxygenase family n=1 Tax=Eremomyces bilateralis CBS 781.70 TaxID=1392243 RepID=A0A6G1G8Q2_9PEZI|nr:oxidoreductase 2-nitropropane dioxygenase family [Eremomyces bilateralis CBS 781.70]KAF1814301.1 oxidoreductase 2-nitropropane dioxygenase family [Eremomyces bilateralis CBS 781.70]
MASQQQLKTPLTELLGINHPVLLAGMGTVASPKLAAAVTNAGGCGVIGGVGYTPSGLREQIAEIKANLIDKNAPFGVDLLLPQVGGTARKTNYDYTKGSLDELVTIMIETGVKIFVCAIGVPPVAIVKRLHAAGILYMNMIGHPKHVAKCIAAGADIICAQGGEGGGHTGDVPTSVLIPAVVELVKGHRSPLTGAQVQVVAAGGMYSGRSLAAALMLGATGVWVGTRFIMATEAGASKYHQEAVKTANHDDSVRSIIYTGRPLRAKRNAYVDDWEENRAQEIKDLTAKGTLPVGNDLERKDLDAKHKEWVEEYWNPQLMGKVAAVLDKVQPAKEIVDEIVGEAVKVIAEGNSLVVYANHPLRFKAQM